MSLTAELCAPLVATLPMEVIFYFTDDLRPFYFIFFLLLHYSFTGVDRLFFLHYASMTSIHGLPGGKKRKIKINSVADSV